MGLTFFNTLISSKVPFGDIKGYSNRVHFWDLDLNFHVNNARYLNYCNQARFVFLSKTGLLKNMAKDRVKPVITENNIKYSRPLKFLNKYNISTEILHSNDKYKLSILHKITTAQHEIATIKVTVAFIDSQDKLSPVPPYFKIQCKGL